MADSAANLGQFASAYNGNFAGVPPNVAALSYLAANYGLPSAYGACSPDLLSSAVNAQQCIDAMLQAQSGAWGSVAPGGWALDSLAAAQNTLGAAGNPLGLVQLQGNQGAPGLPFLLHKDVAELRGLACPLPPSAKPLLVTREAPDSPAPGTPGVLDSRMAAVGSPLQLTPLGAAGSIGIGLSNLHLSEPRNTSESGGSPCKGGASGAATPNTAWEELQKESRLWRWSSPTAESIASGMSDAGTPRAVDDAALMAHRQPFGDAAGGSPMAPFHLSKLVIHTPGSPLPPDALGSPMRAATPAWGVGTPRCALEAAARAYLMSHPAATPNYEIARTLKRHAEASSRPASSVRDGQLLMKLRASVVYPSLNKDDQTRSRAMWGLVIQLHSAGGSVPFFAAVEYLRQAHPRVGLDPAAWLQMQLAADPYVLLEEGKLVLQEEVMIEHVEFWEGLRQQRLAAGAGGAAGTAASPKGRR